MIIDSHEHIFYSLEMQLEKMDAAGVDKTVLFCAAPGEGPKFKRAGKGNDGFE